MTVQSTSSKDPKRVAAAKKAAAARRAKFGSDAEYRQYMSELAVRSNAAQLAALGADGYRQQRKEAYGALVEKIGQHEARQRAKNGAEKRRRWRVSNPTNGEQKLRLAIEEIGCELVLTDAERIDYLDWKSAPEQFESVRERCAVVEATIGGRYMVDVLLPFEGIVVEVDGGCHKLTVERDERRRDDLKRYGVDVLVLSDALSVAEMMRAVKSFVKQVAELRLGR